MSKILLVTLIHNRKHLLSQCVMSAVNQTYRNFEHLLFDNNSTDGAKELAGVFAKKYKNVHLYCNDENIGQQPAFNFILDTWIAKNFPEVEIFSVLDSDDMLTKDALFEVNKMFNAHPEIGQTYSGFNIINRKNIVTTKNHPKARLVPNQFTDAGQLMLRRVFLAQNPIGHQRSFRISCLHDIGGFNTKYQYATDYNAAAKMLEKYPVVKIDKVLYQWRQHDQQVERQHSPQQTKDWKELQKYYKERWTKMGII